MIRLIWLTLHLPSIKFGKALIYASFHESKLQDFVSFHEYKHQDFGSLRESRHQDLCNLDKEIKWKLKYTISHEVIYIASYPNGKGYWYNVMVEWGTGYNTTESLTIIIWGDTITCALYSDDSQEKGEWHKSGRFSHFWFFPPYT